MQIITKNEMWIKPLYYFECFVIIMYTTYITLVIKVNDFSMISPQAVTYYNVKIYHSV